MKKFLVLIFVMFFAFVLVGCGGDEGGAGGAKLSSVQISGVNKLTVGDEVTYTLKFTPADYKATKVEWSSSDETLLSVDQNGKAVAKAEASQVYLYVEVDGVKGQRKIVINAATDNTDYPNLQGYTIRIAQADHALYEYDPFHVDYKGADKEAKQEAWREVEEKFNCKIEVVGYPKSAPWGPDRWKYILDQAAMGTSDYDFLTVPDDKIQSFVEGGALISMEDYYLLYGNNMMDPTYITSGSYKNKLYSFTTAKINIDAVMYYNIPLFETLKETNPNLKEPAQMFLDGEWTHSAFLDYCREVQNTMATVYGVEGTALSDTQAYFAVAGWDSYWWAGLAANDGEALADVEGMKINVTSDHKKQAADIVKSLYQEGLADKTQGVDQGVKSWNDAKALFNTGSLWFVGDAGRWNDTLWGADTRYGYVPWPRANDVAFEDIRVAAGGVATWVMPIGCNYDGYGDYTDEEFAGYKYWAICELYKRTQEIYVSSPTYDPIIAQKNTAARYAHSEASQEAFIYIQNLISAGKGYYDPLVSSDNPVGSLYTGNIKNAVTGYCVKGEYATWEDAIGSVIPVLQEALSRAFS